MENMDDRLWSYIDETASPGEISFIENMIATNLEWRTKYRELLELHQMVAANIELDQPSMRFARNVMEEIGRLQIAPATKTYINKKIIWGIGLFFITLIVGFVVYGISQVNWLEGSNGTLPVDFSKVDYSRFFNNTYTSIFMMINVVLGLMLLDMYLRKRKKQFEEKQA